MHRELVLSCEHAGNKIPAQYKHLFKNDLEVLETHRGYDIGALALTKTLGSVLNVKAHVNKISRLLIDTNRSLHNAAIFSEFVSDLDQEQRQSITREYYNPYRQKIIDAVNTLITSGVAVLHLSVHTFTPVFDGEKRDADIGLLYDPKRKLEKEFCHYWSLKLKQYLPDLRFRMNYPYAGTMDGFTKVLRKQFVEKNYLGVELEVNQRLTKSDSKNSWFEIQQSIARSLEEVLKQRAK